MKDDPAKQKERSRRWYLANREKTIERAKLWRAANPEKTIKIIRKYRAAVRAEIRAGKQQWLKANAEQIRAEKEKKRESGRVKRKVSRLRFTDKNRDRLYEEHRLWAAKHRTEILAYDRKRRAANPNEARANAARRRARKKATVSTLTKADIKAIFAKGCFICGTMNRLSLAHDLPVSKGGNTTRGNTFCLCVSCNSKMRTKTLAELLIQKEFDL